LSAEPYEVDAASGDASESLDDQAPLVEQVVEPACEVGEMRGAHVGLVSSTLSQFS
jgi:hypothetical protein